MSTEKDDAMRPLLAAREAELADLKAKLAIEHKVTGEQAGIIAEQVELIAAREAELADLKAKIAVKQDVPRLHFSDALAMAKACHDYNGGHCGEMYEAFHHGIDTVINVLTAAIKYGLSDPQVQATHNIGPQGHCRCPSPEIKPGQVATVNEDAEVAIPASAFISIAESLRTIAERMPTKEGGGK